MKIYTQSINANEPTVRSFFVTPFSNFKIGINVFSNGVAKELSTVKLYKGGTEIQSDETTNGFKLFPITSENAGDVIYTVKCDGSEYSIVCKVTASTVYNKDYGESYVLPTASASVKGGIKVGSGLSITDDGTLSADAQQYTLPTASASTLGGIKVGANLAIDGNGVLSASGGTSGIPVVHTIPEIDTSTHFCEIPIHLGNINIITFPSYEESENFDIEFSVASGDDTQPTYVGIYSAFPMNGGQLTKNSFNRLVDLYGVTLSDSEIWYLTTGSVCYFQLLSIGDYRTMTYFTYNQYGY